MKLSELIAAASNVIPDHTRDIEIESIHYRSQDVRPGGLFVAIAGSVADGHDYVADALRRGAAAVLVEKPIQQEGVIIRVDNSRRALAQVAGRFYGRPSEQLTIIGITGTNGKTTTSYLVESVLAAAGRQVGVIGTVNYRYNGKVFDNPVTTPESADLQKILFDMLHAGISHVVMEISSHALDLYRVEQCWLDVGVFTNLTRDHLDYHRDMDRYWECKQRMFSQNLAKGPKADHAVAVVNRDDERGRSLADRVPVRAIGVGQGTENSVHPLVVTCDLSGTRASVETPAGNIALMSPLVGGYNLENILCATGVGIALGLAPRDIRSGIEAVATIPGRLEPVPNDLDRFVYVDYAHTPDALENVLACLSPLAGGRLICVFGCGGDRDKGKRPKMGEIAGRLSDLAVVTSDNPRSESPQTIIDQILPGVTRARSRAYSPEALAAGFDRKGYVVTADRREAIGVAIRASLPGDIVLIAGKGHETYQIIGTRTLDFDDRRVAGQALADIGQAHGYEN